MVACLVLFEKEGAVIFNQSRFGPKEKYGKYPDIIVEPRDENLPATIIELKIVNLNHLFPEAQDFNEKIFDGEVNLFMDEDDTEILSRSVYINPGGTTVQAFLDDGLAQVRGYHKLVTEERPRKGGYRAWVCVRVGLTRFVLRELHKQ